MSEVSVSKGRAVFLCAVLIALLVFGFFSNAVWFFAPSPDSEENEPVLWSSSVPLGPEPVIALRATAYNSLEEQTNSEPFVTASGKTTRSGIVALSRDLLERFPYGTTIKIVDVRPLPNLPNGCGATMETVEGLETLPGLLPGEFLVADTMHPRKENQLDVWLEHLEDSIRWGVCWVFVQASPEQEFSFVSRR